MNPIFKGLNAKQLEAVQIVDGPVLVISGPGSGKTKCLTHRIAYLIGAGIAPENILALTFTNKAAGEVKERVGKLIGQKESGPAIGTFHSIGMRILRRDIAKLGYTAGFTIFDADDQVGLIKRIMADLELDTKKFNPQAILSRISRLKTEFTEPENAPQGEFFEKIVAKVYENYHNELKRLNAVDFDDLIVLCVKLFREHPKVLESYQDRWKYILVDEYQDTSHDQYHFITLLAAKHRNLFCIGDDAQSIYQFRRADIRNILNFQKDYPEAKVVMLEQNYRSTKSIITAASRLISNNKNQMPKELWTENAEGERILVKELLNERLEAGFIVSMIRGFVRNGRKPNDIVVLYRTHAQSRAIEEALLSSGLPYHIVGGMKFYERREIKDILAYLKFLTNPADLISFERIYNVPSRGIGKSSYDKVLKQNPDNIWDGMKKTLDEGVLAPRQAAGLKNLYDALQDLVAKTDDINLTGFIKYMIKAIGYEEYLVQNVTKTRDEAEARMDNLRELMTVAKKFDGAESCSEGIARFLEEIALLQDLDKMKETDKKVTLMTVHASKGLEFPIVFVAGMEEGLFPHARTLVNPQEIEEERRLCYVALTRAGEKLILTFTRYRNIFGSTENNLPSRFIGELPPELVQLESSGPDFNDEYEEKIFY